VSKSPTIHDADPGIRNLRPRDGAALVIALAFVVLLTGLIVAFFSRAMTERLVSNSSANEGRVELFALGAEDQIIGDLKQEIVDGSGTSSPATGVIIYTPNSAASAVPALAGFTPAYSSPGVESDGLANLVKCSAWLSGSSVPFYSGTNYVNTGVARASNILSTGTSFNGRSVSPVRWNKPLLIQRLNPSSSTDVTPVTAFPAPAWVLVARNGSTPVSAGTLSGSMTWSPNNAGAIVGRYAYAIYNEGGLLDMNVAGYPSTSGPTQSAYKNALAYADLTQLHDPLGNNFTATQWDPVIGWRNYASTQPSGAFPNLAMPAGAGTTFYNLVLSASHGFLKTAATTLYNNQSDRAFTSRQELINLMTQGVGSVSGSSTAQNLLNYLGTFSRGLDQPSFAPNPNRPATQGGSGGNFFGSGNISTDNLINPAFLSVRVASTFIRNDGSTAQAGEPLVKKRFNLNRLAWLTYKGPSANNMSDTTVQQTITLLGGNPSKTSDPVYQFVAQGTAQNIYNYFGLSWVPDPNNAGSSEWLYSHGGTTPLASSSGVTASAINKLASISGREADFFELLRAGVCLGCLGKTYTTTAGAWVPPAGTPGYYQAQLDVQVDSSVFQLGANIFDQAAVDGYPRRILANTGLFGTVMEYRGVSDLPYLYRVREAKIMTRDSIPASTSGTPAPLVSGSAPADTGAGVVLQEPEIWNPHAWNSTVSDTPGWRPTSFRIIALTSDPNGNPTNNISMYPEWRSNVGTGGNLPNGFYGYSASGTGGPTPNSPFSLNAGNTELDFNIPTGDLYLFREPTLLIKPGIPTNSGLAIGAGNAINLLPGGTPYIKSVNPASQYTAGGATDNKQYIGFLISGTGTLPMVWFTSQMAAGAISGTGASNYVPTTGTSGIVPAEFVNVVSGGPITYRLQYKDTSNNWITYDEKFAPLVCANSYNGWNSVSAGYGSVFAWSGDNIGREIMTMCVDPRTSRFGMNYAAQNGLRGNGTEDMPVMNRGYNAPYGSGFTAGWASPVGTTANNANSAAQNALWTNRPDEYQGCIFGAYNGFANAFCYDTGPGAAGWYPLGSNFGQQGYTSAVIAPGLLCQNNPGVANSTNAYRFAEDNQGAAPVGLRCFADPDGVIRRGMSAYVLPNTNTPGTAPPSGAGSGLPLKTAYTFSAGGTITANAEAASRPIILHRPFQSVAELGTVFSGTPWRNIDFSTPESGYSALLDVFSVGDTDDPNGMVAGRLDLNTRQSPVIQAFLSGAYKDALAPTDTIVATGNASATSVATALVTRTTTSPGPIANISELVGKWSAATTVSGATAPFNIDGGQSYIGFSGTAATTTFTPSASPVELSSVLAADSTTTSPTYGYNTQVMQRYRDATIRALSNAGQTRVWNLMIDLVAQTGRYPSSAASLNNFLVEGEQRYWVHLAIDRLTGQVIDKQIEVVRE
jgi:hypothetical protein